MDVRVMIVEDEKEVRLGYRQCIEDRPGLQLVAETDNQEEALLLLQTTVIDALILDLEMPQGSGILLLQKLQQMSIEKPFIIVVTNVTSKVIYDTIRSMGVDYICTKDGTKFSLEHPVSIIELSAPYRKSRRRTAVISKTSNADVMNEIHKRKIESELSDLGFLFKNSGALYLREGLLYIVLSEHKEISLTKELYPYIASKFNTNASNVEKNIRNAIEKVWTEQDVGKLKDLYPYVWNDKTGRPTNAELIFNIAQRLFPH